MVTSSFYYRRIGQIRYNTRFPTAPSEPTAVLQTAVPEANNDSSSEVRGDSNDGGGSSGEGAGDEESDQLDGAKAGDVAACACYVHSYNKLLD